MTTEFLTIIKTFQENKKIEILFKEITSAQFLTSYINIRLEELGTYGKEYLIDNFYFNPFILYDCEDFILKLTYNRLSPQKIIETSIRERHFAPLKLNGEIYYNLYNVENIETPDILNKDVKLNLKEQKQLMCNEIVSLMPFNSLFSPMSNCDGLFMTLEYKKKSNFSWYFDMESLKPVFHDFNDDTHKKIEATLEILNEIGTKASIKVLENLTEHENHTIRWKSVGVLINIDFYKGIECLKKLKNDLHPEIREAATTSLNSIKQ